MDEKIPMLANSQHKNNFILTQMPPVLLTWIKFKKNKKTKQTRPSLRKMPNYEKILYQSWSQNLCGVFVAKVRLPMVKGT